MTKLRPASSAQYSLCWHNKTYGSLLDHPPLPASEQSVNKEHDDGADHCADQSSAFVWPIPTQCLAQIAGDKGTNNAENGREDEARRLVVARHNKLGNHTCDEANDDRPKDA